VSFSDFYVTHRTRKSNFLNQIDHLIEWAPIEKAINQHYAPSSDATGRPAYSGLLLFKMLLVGIWHGGLSDEAVEDMANANLHVMRFLGLSLEDDVPDHSVLSRFRTRLTAALAWNGLLEQVNQQIQALNVTVSTGCQSMPASRIARANPRPSRPMKWSTTAKSGMMSPKPKRPCESLRLFNPVWMARPVGSRKAASRCLVINNTRWLMTMAW